METLITCSAAQLVAMPTGKSAFPPNDKLVTFRGILLWRSVWACIIVLTTCTGTLGYIWALDNARERVERNAFELRTVNSFLFTQAVDSDLYARETPATIGVQYRAAKVLLPLTTEAQSSDVVKHSEPVYGFGRVFALDRFHF